LLPRLGHNPVINLINPLAASVQIVNSIILEDKSINPYIQREMNDLGLIKDKLSLELRLPKPVLLIIERNSVQMFVRQVHAGVTEVKQLRQLSLYVPQHLFELGELHDLF
jgi:hypothetical protein